MTVLEKSGNIEKTFYDKLVEYDDKHGIQYVQCEDYGFRYSDILPIKSVTNFKLPINKPFLLMGKRKVGNDKRLRNQLKGIEYTFYLFVPEENYERFIYGKIFRISDLLDSNPSFIPTTIMKHDLFVHNVMFGESFSFPYRLCEVPDLDELVAL